MSAEARPIRQNFVFGAYRLVPHERRLFRVDTLVMLPPKEFDLLLLLVRAHGEVMDRETLIKALWPNTVVEDANLNVHISALRKTLAEGAGEQRFIETLPRLGYRFIAPVSETNEPEPLPPSAPPLTTPEMTPDVRAVMLAATPTHLTHAPQSETLPAIITTQLRAERASWFKRPRLTALVLPLWLLMLGFFGLLGVLLFKPFQFSRTDSAAGFAFNVVPLTTYPGRETHPTFSPDGKQFAFTWSGENESNSDIYVRLVEGGNWVRVTSHPGEDVNPVWSPDGGKLAFYRSAPEGDGIYLVPALGGAERKLTSVWANRFGFGTHSWLHWSPDGKTLALSDKPATDKPFSLFSVSAETGERRRLTNPPLTSIGDCSPAFSPDGRWLAFVRVMSAVIGEVYVMPVTGGEPRQVTFTGAGASNLTWALGGREIVYSSRHSGKTQLFRIPASGGTPQWLASSGTYAQYPTFSDHGQRLVWVQNTDNTDIFRVALKRPTEAAKPPAGLILSTATDVSPRYSPDGQRIVFVSNRSGSDEIWLCDSDGTNPTQLTAFRGPLAGSPNWSPDGQQIVFDCRPDGNPDVFIVSATGGQPRRLTTDPAEDIVPSWSRDGQWIYFSSNRSEQLQIWKLPVTGGAAIQLTKQGGFEPQEAPDGSVVYYTQERGASALWRVAPDGSNETAVYDFRQKNYSRVWAVTNEGLYFAAALERTRLALRFVDFANPAQIKTVAEVSGNIHGGVSGLSLAPDGQSLIFPLVAQRGCDLMMIENFH